jgi:hypothetical protein
MASLNDDGIYELFAHANHFILNLELKFQQLQTKSHQLDLILASLTSTQAQNEDFPLEILPQPGFLSKSIEFENLIEKMNLNQFPENLTPVEQISNLPDNSIGLLFPQMMNQQEMSEIISFCEQSQVEMIPASTRINYRNCQRVEIISPKFALFLWNRLLKSHHHSLFHEQMHNASNKHFDQENAVDLEGIWEPYGLNELIRIILYPANGHFSPHYDGHYVFDRNHRTFLTCMMYLTDGFQGGATEFLSASAPLVDAEERQTRPILSTSIISSIKPKAGTCIVFSHHLLHQGGQVSDQNMLENKWILRTEVCFRRVSAPERPLTQIRALELLEQARVAENHQDYQRAQELYRAAFKLYPELNHIIK